MSTLASPDGQWEARLEQAVYQIAPIGGATVLLELHIVPKGAPVRYIDDDPTLAVTHVDWVNGTASSFFILQWTNNDRLIVQCGRWDDASGAKRQIGAVAIEYQKMKTSK